MQRREFLAGMAAAPLAAIARPEQAVAAQAGAPAPKRNPIRQSVMASVWGANSKLSFEERCQILSKIGFKGVDLPTAEQVPIIDRKSTRLNSSHSQISYAVFCLKKKNIK